MRWIKQCLENLLVSLMIVMTVVVLWGITTRYFFAHQASWTEELARFLLIWIGLVGAAYVSGIRKHLAIDLLQSALNPVQNRYLSILLSSLIILFSFFVMVVGGMRLMYVTNILGQTSPALHLPMYLIYMVIPLSGLLVILFEANHLLSRVVYRDANNDQVN